jgi:RNA polymerase sigma factor (sigma-70 family)
MQNWFRRSTASRAALAPFAGEVAGTAAKGPGGAPPSQTLRRDRALLRRWRDGDRDAGLELLDHYAALVRVVAFRLGVRDAQALLDLHQELVVRILDQLDTLAERVETSFAGWLAWQVRDLGKRRRSSAPACVGATGELEDMAAPDPSERTAAWDAIASCRDRLPERERAVFELRYVEGLSLQEVAERVASNSNAVAQSIFRLVRRMRACLSTQGYDLRAHGIREAEA